MLREQLHRHVDDVLDAAIRRERIVGAVVEIAMDGRMVYSRAVGFADRELALSTRPETIFRFASLTKPIVSAAALRLVEQGLLELDAPITRWLPDFGPISPDGNVRPISLRHLLTHTAGLNYGFGARRKEFEHHGVGTGLNMPGLDGRTQLARLSARPLDFSPGTAWQYSLASDVLGEVMAAASGTDLPTLVRRLITGPLGMVDTGFAFADPERLAAPYADGMPRPFRMADEQDVPNRDGLIHFSTTRNLDPNSFPSGGAGMVGTAGDFLVFLECLRTGGAPILTPASVKLITSDQLPAEVTYPQNGWRFGMGAEVLCDPSLAQTPHDAGTWRWSGGYGNDWFVNPKRRLTVVSLTNTAFEGVDGAFPQNLRDAIYYALTA